MSAQSESRFLIPYQKIIEHLRTPLYRNGYFLTLSSLATSGIGLIYWVLVAHKYQAFDVGINTAVISSMTFLAGISEINLMSALIRFIPVTGRFTKRFVLYAYLVSLLFAFIASIIYLTNLSRWSPALEFLGKNRTLAAWFIISTMMWCIFVLQDSVLTGLRRASWVPVENSVFSLTKIALMILFAVSIPTLGIFASWSIALVVAILPTNYYIFRKLIPDHIKQTGYMDSHVSRSQVMRFVAPDYVGAIFWLICTTLMPVIVTTVSGATANAYFYLAWTIANTLYLIAPSMGSSLVVEASSDQKKLANYSYLVFINTMKLVVPAAVIIAIGAPFILMIFGKGYSAQGATLLRLLALSAIPHTVNSIFVSASRVRRRMVAVVATSGSLYTIILILSYVLLKTVGIAGVGIGWLASQLVVAAIVYLTQLRKLWAEEGFGKSGSKHSLFSLIGHSSLFYYFYQVAMKFRFVHILSYFKMNWTVHQRKAKALALLPLIADDFPSEFKKTMQGTWQLHSIVKNQTNITIALFKASGESPPIVVKLPGNAKETESLERQSENLLCLHNDERLGEWRNLLPRTISKGAADGYGYYAESAMPGVPVIKLIKNQGINPRVVNLAADEIGILHQKTASLATIGPDLLEQWVIAPLGKVSHFTSAGSPANPLQKAVDRLQSKLNAALYGQQACVSWIHGDYSPSNVLISPDGSKITGIVDWDLARPNGLPSLDLMHLLLSLRMEMDRRELGLIVRDLLLTNNWRPEELQIFKSAYSNLPGSALDLRNLLLLAWLHHINANISKTSRYDNNGLWISGNIYPVLKAI